MFSLKKQTWTRYKRVKLSGVFPENLDQGHEYRPNSVRSVLTTEIKILPNRPTKLN